MLVEAVRHRERLAVIGNRQVLQPGLARRERHRLDVFAAVGLGGVRVNVAADVLERDEVRQRAPLGRVDLAAPLAQLGRNLRQTERVVDLRLGPPGHERPVVDAKETVLVQLEPARDRSVAQRDVVRFRSGEILHGRAAALLGHEPEIGLDAAPEPHARLGFALTENALDELVHRERRHHVRVAARREDVDVARRVGAAPDAADVVEDDRRAFRAQVVEQQRRGLGGVGQQVAARVLFPLGARSKNELFLLRAQSFQLAHAAVAARGLELLDRLDAELGVEQRDGFGTDALEVEQVEYRRRKLLEQIPVIARLAGLGNLADLRREILADAGNGAQLLFGAGTRACSVAWAIVSDAFRYARILKGFSLLISSRSAISEKMRAMARFSMSHRNDARRNECSD